MKQKLIYGFYACLITLFFISYEISYSFFSDAATSTSNVFSAATTFPTPTPTGTELVISSPTPTSTPTATPTPAPVANHVVISEVQISGDGVSPSDDEFVELYNPTSEAIVMTAWRLRRKNSAGTEETLVNTLNGTIPAHGYFLIVDANGYNGGVAGDTPYSAPSQAMTNSYTVLLYGDAGITLVDKLGFGTSPDPEISPFLTNPTSGQSLERKALSTSTSITMEGGSDVLKGNGYDAGDNSTDFVLRLVSDPQNSSSSTETP